MRIAILVFLIFISIGTEIKAQVYELDSIALIELFRSTGGKDWVESWPLKDPINKWKGVKVNDDGRVVSLKLINNNLVGYLPKDISNLNKLEVLNLSSNKLEGKIPEGISNLFLIKSINLSDNNFSGNIPESLFVLPYLESFLLAGNGLSGEISPRFRNYKNLKILDLSRNNFMGEVPANLGGLKSLVKLNLSWNDLSGSIPDQLSGLRNLEYLNLEHNDLENSLPIDFCSLNKLKSLFLNNNERLFGILPLSFSKLKNLLIFSYRKTNIVAPKSAEFNFWLLSIPGYYPSELKKSKDTYRKMDSLSLVALYKELGGENWIHKWDFSKPMTEWKRVSFDRENERVESLFLHNNGLIGVIPREIGNLTNLNTIVLGRNKLHGKLPKELTSVKLIVV